MSNDQDLEAMLAQSRRNIEAQFAKKRSELVAKSPYLSGISASENAQRQIDYWKARAMAAESRARENDNNNGAEPFAPASGPSTHNMDEGDQRISQFDNNLSRQLGQGIGDIQSNVIEAELTKTAEEGQAEAVGKEAELEEKLRLNLEEESSGSPTRRIGPDKNGKYLPLLERHTPPARDFYGKLLVDPRSGEPLYNVSIIYGYRVVDSLLRKRGRDVDINSLSDAVYNHAKNARIRFGDHYDRGLFFNPTIRGEDFTMHFYTSYRKPGDRFFYGLIAGPRVELTFFKPVTKRRLEQIILATESDSAPERLSEEENA